MEISYSLASICADAEETICRPEDAYGQFDSRIQARTREHVRYRAGRQHQGT